MWTNLLAGRAKERAVCVIEWERGLVGPARELETEMVAKLRKNDNGLNIGVPVQQDSPDRFAPNAATADVQGPVDMLAVGSPLPKSIGLCADLYSDVRALRLMMEKEVEVVQARETEIKNWIIDNLSKSDDTGAAGKRFRAQIVMKEVPQLADWATFTGYVLDKDRFDLIQKRLSEKAIKDMWEAGEDIPGVAKFNTPTVSITKI